MLQNEKVLPASVRNTLMIAAGDLSIRFPNLVEQQKENLYKRFPFT